MPFGALSICQVSNQLSGKLVNVHASEVIDLLGLETEDGRAKDDRYVDATAVEYFSVHDLPPIEGPCGKGCACWAAIARQIALGQFAFRLEPRPTHLRDAVSNSFHRTLEVRGNKHPRFTGLDEIEQSPILLGCPICSAVLHSHQNTLISSPSRSSPFERDFSKVDIQSHGARADGVFGSVQLHSDLTSLHVGERQRAQPFVVLRRPRTNFSHRRHRSPISSTSAPALQAGGCHHFDISLKKQNPRSAISMSISSISWDVPGGISLQSSGSTWFGSP